MKGIGLDFYKIFNVYNRTRKTLIFFLHLSVRFILWTWFDNDPFQRVKRTYVYRTKAVSCAFLTGKTVRIFFIHEARPPLFEQRINTAYTWKASYVLLFLFYFMFEDREYNNNNNIVPLVGRETEFFARKLFTKGKSFNIFSFKCFLLLRLYTTPAP